MEPQEGKKILGKKMFCHGTAAGPRPTDWRANQPPWLFPNVWHRGKTLKPAIVKLGLPLPCIAKNVLPLLFFSGILAKHSGERPTPNSPQNCRWEDGGPRTKTGVPGVVQNCLFLGNNPTPSGLLK
jgi:hypothetical protein